MQTARQFHSGKLRLGILQRVGQRQNHAQGTVHAYISNSLEWQSYFRQRRDGAVHR
jgi:hypothetical protein